MASPMDNHWFVILAQYEVKIPEVVFMCHCNYYDALGHLDDCVKADARMKMVRQLGLFVLAASEESGSYHTSLNFEFYPDELHLAQPWRK
jgi:hypothetical protein